MLKVLLFLLFASLLSASHQDCEDPELCPETWAFQHRSAHKARCSSRGLVGVLLGLVMSFFEKNKKTFKRRPFLRFDGSAQDYCYPDEATNSNNGQCAEFNPEAPIYYKIVRCGDFLKLAWHFWYGLQRGCDPFGVDHGKGRHK